MLRCCAAALALAASLSASAQEPYPVKPIRTIIPIPPGAGVDIVMRKASDELLPRLGQPFVVDNQPGANFIIGATSCARARPDGYTMCVLTGDNLTMNAYVFAKLPYDPVRDFKPVTNLFILSSGIFAKRSLKVKSVAELRALAASAKDGLTYGTLGPNTSTDLVRMWLADEWKAKLIGVPYKGGNLIINALVAAEIDMGRIGVYNALGPLKSGRLTLLAHSGLRRFKVLADVPTNAEVGLADMPGGGWWGIFMPSGTPDSMVRRINAEILWLFRQPKFAEYLEDQLVDITVSTPEEFAAFIERERERTGRLARKYRVTPQ